MSMISIDVQEAQAAAAKYQSASEQITAIISELTAVNQSQLGSWVGVSKEKFLLQFEEMRPFLSNFVELIQGAGAQLNSVATNFGEHDQTLGSQMGLK